MLKNDLFLRACRQQETERTPIWIMRQAGRYLPEYMAVKDKVDFVTLCRTPELAAEVTIQPVDIIGIDAAILFSDILVIPDAMGMEFMMKTGVGPVFEDPIRCAADAEKLHDIDPNIDLKYVMDAIGLTKKELDNRVPLIGFTGSPWTLLCYMVEGAGSKHFNTIKSLIYHEPELAHNILKKLAKNIAAYLNAKIEAGVNAVQIFDTWGGLLSQDAFKEFSLNYMAEIISNLKRTDQPVILFAKGVHHSIDEIVKAGPDVIGCDYTMDLGDMRAKTGGKVALQGNMDPCMLFSSQDRIKEEVNRIFDSYGDGPGHIFNLGHGILPTTDPENAKAFVRFVHEESEKRR